MLLRRTRLTLAGSAAVLALVLAGCAGADPEVEVDVAANTETSSEPSPSASPSESAPSESASSESPSPSETADPSPTESATAASGPMTLPDRLLTADEMPGFNPQWAWTEGETRKAEGADPFGTCHKFAMTSIGAMRVTMRDYLPPAGTEEGVGGSNLVAEFPDQRTARRAFEVLQSWRGQCEEELQEYERRSIGGFDTVQVDGAEGGWYLLIYGPVEGGSPDDGYFDAQGFVRVGKRISVLQMRGIGQDYNYDTGQEPLVEGVRTSAAKLG